MRRVEFSGGKHARVEALFDLIGIERVGKVAGHQRGEAMFRWQRGQDAVAVGDGGSDAGDRRHQVGHHDGTSVNRAGIGQDRIQHRVVAQVNMPVVRAADSKLLRVCSHQ